MKSSPATFARHFYHAYRNGPIRIGHSLIRRMLDPVLAKQQAVQLASGLKLSLDMTRGNQNSIFWHDGNGDVNLYWASRELVPLGGTFVDCGANCGLIGLLARQCRQARVVFIEPHPRLAQSVLANIKLNHFEAGCELIEAAVSDAAGEITFYEDPKNDGSHSVLADWGGELRAIGKVPCQTLKAIAENRNLGRIHFLKIDTEGNDYNALKSLGTLLDPATVEVIHVEISRDHQAICDLLQSRGYTGFVGLSRHRRQTARAKRIYETGGPACFFAPLQEPLSPPADVLWCGRSSSQAAYLDRLYSAERT